MTKRTIFFCIATAGAIFVLILVMANRGTDMEINRNITPSEALAKMQNPGAIILDVRTAREFATGRIPGAILLPDYELRERAHIILPNKDALILVYCRSGVRSSDALQDLLALGYTNVFNFGGIINWPYETE